MKRPAAFRLPHPPGVGKSTAQTPLPGLWIVGNVLPTACAVGYSLPRYFIARDRVTTLGKAAYVLATGVMLLALVLLTPWIVELARTR